jgi:NAD(P)-dependent dehydrogenase (short-subunit alcohol dehydrogenase family)
VPGRLEGKLCVITGAGSGIGRAAAVLFAREGAQVVVADRDREAGEATCRELAGAVSFVETDVTEEDSCRSLARTAVDRHGRIDVLFNNAGVSGVGVLHEIELEAWERVFAVNVRGVFLVAKHVLPVMIEQRSGSVINMSSTIAEIGLANRASYAASKGAVLALTRSMQVDYAPYGIRVNALLPGTILTPFVERYLRDSYADYEEGLATIKKRQLTGDLGSPEDVAAAALFLASDESRFVLGSGLFVDGGVRGTK